MTNVTDFPIEPKRDLIKEMTGCELIGNEVKLHGRIVPNMVMYDRRPKRNVIEFSVGRAMFEFPPEQAWNAAAFAFAAMAIGAGCDDLNFEPLPFAMKYVSLGEIGSAEE